ncbi:MAG: ATP-binding protein [Bacteroidota bacterium]
MRAIILHIISMCLFTSVSAQERTGTIMDSLDKVFDAARAISFDSARTVMIGAVADADAKNDLPLKTEVLKRLALSEATNRRFISTYDRYLELLEACKAVKDSICIGKTYNRIGHIHMLKNQYPLALTNGLEGVRILSRYEDIIPDDLAAGYDELVYTYWRIDRLEEAENAALRSLEIRIKHASDSTKISKSARAVGETYYRKNQLDKSQQYLDMAVDYSDNPNHLVNSSLARLAEKKGDLRLALFYHKEAFAYIDELMKRKKRPIPYIRIITNVADHYAKLYDYENAIFNYEKALSFAKQENLEYETASAIYKGLSQVYEELGNYEQSLAYYKSRDVIQDSVRRAANEEKINELEAKYQAQRQAEEITQLNALNQQRTRERNWLFVGITVTLLLAALIYNLYRSRHIIINNLASQKLATESVLEELKSTQSQLIQSEKMASLGQLTAGLAHEINNPVNFIASNIKALKMDFQDLAPLLEKLKQLETSKEEKVNTEELKVLVKQVEFGLIESEIEQIIGSIDRGVARTTNIIKNLKTFSRKTSGEFAPVNINEGLDFTLTILNHEIKAKEVEIQRQFGVLPLVHCDLSLLNQVFVNIISNAIQAVASSQERIIKIATQQQSERVQIKIADTGMGMDEATSQKIFEPFFTTKKVGKGTGLGLSISYNIIKQHQGTIEVDSTPNVGTTFTISLPIEQ